VLTFHSCDRDYNKFPDASVFEIPIPNDYRNIQTIRLLDYEFPVNNYNISESNQNNKLKFTYSPLSGSDISGTITINDGFYDIKTLKEVIQNSINKILIDEPQYTFNLTTAPFVCEYNEVENKLYFGVKDGSFSFHFDHTHTYTGCQSNKSFFARKTHWGLGFYLGFKEKKTYYSSGVIVKKYDVSGVYFQHKIEPWLPIPTSATNTQLHVIEADTDINLFGDDAFYIEFDRYNTIDELDPFTTNTNSSYNNSQSFKQNGSFAKIPVPHIPFGKEASLRKTVNISHYNPPISNLKKLKCKIRYHDGRLVEFKNNQYSFSLEFLMVKDQPSSNQIINVPKLWDL
jgi:hypothetical protein